MDNRSTFLYHFYGDKGGTQKDRLSMPIGHGVFSILGNTEAGKSTLVVKLRIEGSRVEIRSDSTESRLPRKTSLSLTQECPYHKPTLVGGDKSPKVIEIILFKELGNLTP